MAVLLDMLDLLVRSGEATASQQTAGLLVRIVQLMRLQTYAALALFALVLALLIYIVVRLDRIERQMAPRQTEAPRNEPLMIQ